MGDSADNPFFIRHRPLLSDAQWKMVRSARFVVAGAGGLGTHVLDLLVRLGVRHIEIWDPATLDEPDLNRQSLYTRRDLGKRKCAAAAERLLLIHDDAQIVPVPDAVTASSPLGAKIGGVDICFDCLDSFQARAQLEAAAVSAWTGMPPTSETSDHPVYRGIVIHGGVTGYHGQVALLRPPRLGFAQLLGPDFARIPVPVKPVMPHAVATVAATQVGELFRWTGANETARRDGDEATLTMIVVDAVTGENERLVIDP